jgi:hypothetical protein
MTTPTTLLAAMAQVLGICDTFGRDLYITISTSTRSRTRVKIQVPGHTGDEAERMAVLRHLAGELGLTHEFPMGGYYTLQSDDRLVEIYTYLDEADGRDVPGQLEIYNYLDEDADPTP